MTKEEAHDVLERAHNGEAIEVEERRMVIATLMKNGQRIQTSELAETFGVDGRQIQRDIRMLRKDLEQHLVEYGWLGEVCRVHLRVTRFLEELMDDEDLEVEQRMKAAKDLHQCEMKFGLLYKFELLPEFKLQTEELIASAESHTAPEANPESEELEKREDDEKDRPTTKGSPRNRNGRDLT